MSHPPSGYGIWFYCDWALPTLSLWLLLCLGCGVSFLVSSRVFLSMIVLQLVVIPELSQEGVNTCLSTLPSWTNLSSFGFFLPSPHKMVCVHLYPTPTYSIVLLFSQLPEPLILTLCMSQGSPEKQKISLYIYILLCIYLCLCHISIWDIWERERDRERERYFNELAHTVMTAGQSEICWAACK